MAVYQVIFNRQSSGVRLPAPESFESAKALTEVEIARVLEVEATTEEEAAALILHFFGGDIASSCQICTKANLKEPSF